MTRVQAVRYVDLPDAEIGRLLAGRYRDLAEADPDNTQNRVRNLDAPITEAVRRLKSLTRKDPRTS